MISIIICSAHRLLLDAVSVSIHDTIGVEYEIIAIENSDARLSIAEAYNQGARQARYDILIFVHEDVVFHSNMWGEKLINFFDELDNPGVLGVAGSSYQSISPIGWWLPDVNYLRINIIQATGDFSKCKQRIDINAKEAARVYAIDGVFMAIKRKVFEEFLFDIHLPGFHGYDLSLSLRTTPKYYNYFIPDILIEHFSAGKPNETWVRNIIEIYQSLNYRLPLALDGKMNKKLEQIAFYNFLQNLSFFKTSKSEKIRTGFKYMWNGFKIVRSFKFLSYYLRFFIKLYLNK